MGISGRSRHPFRVFLLHSLPRSLSNSVRHDSLTYAAALAFFFLFAIFPLLIFLASLLAYLPVPNLFDQIVRLMSVVIPATAMGRVRMILSEILRTNVGLLSFGVVTAVWIASGGFNALIGVLDHIFEVRQSRPYWKQSLLALGLTLLIGVMVMVALLASLLGPLLWSLLPKVLGVHSLFVILWPYIQWTSVVVLLILALQITYLVAPSHHRPFFHRLPGPFSPSCSGLAFPIY
jgi:membrane protein